MALTKIGTDGVKDDAVTSDKVANSINTAIAANTAKTQTTINNNADNRVITGSGTANTLNAESGVVIDSAGRLLVGTTTDNGFKLKVSDGGGYEFAFAPNDSGVNSLVNYNRSGSSYVPFKVIGSDLRFGSGGDTERMRIDSSGRMLIGSTDGASYADSSMDDLVIGSTANGKNDGITILSGTGQTGSLAFADSGGTSRGLVGYVHNGDYLRFHAGGNLKARIDTDGLKFNGDTASANALHDYEEGTWTPKIKRYQNGGWQDATMTDNGTVQSAIYRKIGALVHFQLYWNGWQQSNSNYAVLGGLPYAALGGGFAGVTYSDAFQNNPDQAGMISNNGQQVEFYRSGNQWNTFSTSSSRTIYMSGTYITAS